MKTTVRPIKYHGGKHYLANQILNFAPPHTHYAETHFGGGAVLFKKDYEGVSEVVNDIDFELMNFWHVLRDLPQFEQFQRQVEATPFSSLEFEESFNTSISPVDRAVKFFIRNRMSRQALGTSYANPTRRTRRGMNEQVSSWLSAVECLPEFHNRLKRVEIVCQDAVDFIKNRDHEKMFFYVDPPYLHSTRSAPNAYTYEMTDAQHRLLLGTLMKIKGKFILSGYDNSMYATAAKHGRWSRHEIEIDNKASSAKKKDTMTEVLWANYELT